MWDDLMRATCLMLVLEGLLPAIAPQRWQFTVAQLAQAHPSTVRTVGLVCMIAGALALFALHR